MPGRPKGCGEALLVCLEEPKDLYDIKEHTG